MNNSNSVKKTRFTKFLILVICVLLATGIALATVFGGSSQGVANGAYGSSSEGNSVITFGEINPNIGIDAAYGEVLSASSFGFFDNGTGPWTHSFKFSSYTIQSNNQLLYEDGDTDTNLCYAYDVQNNWRIGTSSNAYYGASYYLILYYQLPQFLRAMSQNSNVKLETNMSFSLNSVTGKNTKNSYYKVFATNSIATASDSSSCASAVANHETGNLNTGTKTTSKIEVSGEVDYIGLAIGFNFGAYAATWKPRYIDVSDIALNFTISRKDAADNASLKINDGSSPVKLSDANFKTDDGTVKTENGVAVDSAFPYRSAYDSSWPVYYNGIDASNYLDDYSSNEFKSFTNTGLTTDMPSNQTYYKTWESDFVDTYNYAFDTQYDFNKNYSSNELKSAGVGGYTKNSDGSYSANNSDTRLKAVSGIKKFTFNATQTSGNGRLNQSVNMYSVTSNQIVELKTDSDVVIAYVRFTKTTRCHVRMKLYVKYNMTISFTVSDYGEDVSEEYSLTFGGIDRTAPSQNPTVTSDYMNTNLGSADLKWSRIDGFSVSGSIEAGSAGNGEAPLLWFCDVTKSLSSTFASSVNTSMTYAQIKNLNLQPIAYSGFTRFNYNFATGALGTIGGGTSVDASKSGSGYYRFAFYAVDMAGNVNGNPTVYYMKVDNDTPNMAATMSFVKNGNTFSVDPFSSTAWAAGQTTFTLELVKSGISGSSLVFKDNSGVDYFISYDAEGKIQFFTEGGTKLDDRRLAIPIKTMNEGASNVAATIEYRTVSGKNYITVTFADAPYDIAWNTAFTLYNGVMTSIDDTTANSNASVSYTFRDERNRVREAYIFIDKNAPAAPVLQEEGEEGDGYLKLAEPNGGTLTYDLSTREWYTNYDSKNKSLKTSESFEDEVYGILQGSGWTFGGDLNFIYVGIKHFTTLAAFNDYLTSGAYKKYGDGSFSANYQDSVKTALGLDKLDVLRPATDCAVDLLEQSGAGLRLVFVWAKDQAGNVSALKPYYIFADNTKYSVTTDVAYGDGTGDGATISSNARQYLRGDVVTLNLWVNISDADNILAPYVLKRNFDGLDEEVLTNYSANPLLNVESKFARIFTIRDEYGDVVAQPDVFNFSETSDGDVQQGTVAVQTLFDSSVDFGPLNSASTNGKAISYTFAYRKVINLTWEVSADYTAKPAARPIGVAKTSHMVAIDEGAVIYYFVTKDGYKLFVDNDGNLFYKDNNDAYFYLDSDGVAHVLNGNGDYTTGEGEDEVVHHVDITSTTLFVPTDAGSYYYVAYIERNDPKYVQFNPDSNAHAFIINKAQVTITVMSGLTSVFGDVIDLDGKYTVSCGTVEKIEDLIKNGSVTVVGSLVIEGAWNDSDIIPAKTHNVVQGVPFDLGANYNVTFVGGEYVVTARPFEVVVEASEKTYGDEDPEFEFKAPFAEFNWYRTLFPDATREDLINYIINDVFKGYTVSGQVSDGVIFKAKSGQVEREAGKDVLPNQGTYKYTSATFTLDGLNNVNFAVTSDIESNGFLINQRSVLLNVDGNVDVVALGKTEDKKNDKVLVYTLADNNDEKLKDEIDALLYDGEGHFLITIGSETTPTEDLPSNYAKQTYFIINLGTNGNANIHLSFSGSGDHYYIVYETDKAVIISLSSATWNEIFGTLFSNDLITWDTLKSKGVIVESKDVTLSDIARVEFDLTVNNAEVGRYLTVGGHNVTFTNVHVFGADGNEIVDSDNPGVVLPAFINSFVLNVSSAVINVAPTYGSLEKVYGDPESTFGIGFEITSVNGSDFTGSYAGYDSAALIALIRGAYIRVVYDAAGNRVAIGEQYDNITVGGLQYNTTNYYGIGVGTQFSSGDPNFTVTAAASSDARFVINKKLLDLDVVNFKGMSRSYKEGMIAVGYPENFVVYNLDSQLVRPIDVVSLSFTAVYSEMGALDKETHPYIIFSNLALAGDGAFNYALGTIVNSDYGKEIEEGSEIKLSKLFLGDDEVQNATVGDTVKAWIYYIDNISKEELITIYTGLLGVLKNDFTVTKVYDNNTGIVTDNISIRLSVDDDGYGTDVLVGIQDRMVIINDFNEDNFGELFDTVGAIDNRYSGVTVSDRYVVNIALFFPLKGANGLKVNRDGKYASAEITIATDRPYNRQEGIVLIIKSLNASITQKVIDAKSFVEDGNGIVAENRDYNSRAAVNVTARFKADAFAPGDTEGNVGVLLNAGIKGKDFGVGEHEVEILGTSSIRNANYKLDVESINDTFKDKKAIKVNIDYAKLIPNVKFNDRPYNGSAALKEGTDFTFDRFDRDYDGWFTTLHYSAELMDELTTFTFGSVEFVLSANGVENKNVMADANGVLPHNVMVRKAVITEKAGNDFLKNYVIYGQRYIDDKYSSDSIFVTSGEEIAAYEIFDEITITKQTVGIGANFVKVADKVYDATDSADVDVTLTAESGIVEVDLPHIKADATGRFIRRRVEQNLDVIISDMRIYAIDEEGNGIINNYVLRPYNERRKANILPRPVGVEVSFDEKVYDGKATVKTTAIHVDIYGIMPNERSGYGVSGTAMYVDKNVELSGGEAIAKLAALTNPKLYNQRGDVNYTPMLASRVKPEDPSTDETYRGYVKGDEYFGKDAALPTDENGVRYLYELPFADRYLLKSNTQNVEKAKNAGIIVGYDDSSDRYLVDSSLIPSGYDGQFSGTLTGASTVKYVKGLGKINPKLISISASGIEVLNPQAFIKMYDGTTEFFGVRRQDYRFGDDSIVGKIAGDDVSVKSVSAEYDLYTTMATCVLIAPSDIDGKDAGNYRVDSTVNAGVARITGRILPRRITAALQDSSTVYGTMPSEVGGTVVYSIKAGDDVLPLTLYNEGLYMLVSDFGKMIEKDNYVPTGRDVYRKDGDAFITVTYDDLNDAEKAECYVMLRGITAFPSVQVSYKAGYTANDYARSYTLRNVTVDNFEFVPTYTDGNTSKLLILQRDIYVDAYETEAEMEYAGEYPNVTLRYRANGTSNVFAPGENETSVFANAKIEVRRKLLNLTTGEATDVEKYPELSEELNGYAYVIYLEFTAPDKFNYNVHLGDGFTVENGRPVRTYEGSELKGNVTVINLVRPRIKNVSLNNVTGGGNEFSVTYNESNLVPDVLTGAINRATDEFIFELAESGAEIELVNAGIYEGYVIVRRPVKKDDGDTRGVKAEWRSGRVTVVVGKASPNLKVLSGSKYYDGTRYDYVLGNNDRNSVITYSDKVTVSSDSVTINYKKRNDRGEFVSIGGILDAGTYMITVELGNKFETDNPNYRKETVTATYNVLRAVVNVVISTEGYTTSSERKNVVTLGTVFDANKNYDASCIGYSVEMKDKNLPQSIAIPKEATQVVFDSKADKPGRYPFSIRITDDHFDASNYNLVGAEGILELTTANIANETSKIELPEAIVANRFVSNEIIGNAGTVYEGELWDNVSKYMPHIDGQASLSAIIELEVYYGDTKLDMKGKNVKVDVALPANVTSLDGIAFYTVTENGGLVRLTDYEVSNDGRTISYSTSNLSPLIIVDVNPSGLPLWVIITICVVAGIVAIAAIWTTIALIIRKRQLRDREIDVEGQKK